MSVRALTVVVLGYNLASVAGAQTFGEHGGRPCGIHATRSENNKQLQGVSADEQKDVGVCK